MSKAISKTVTEAQRSALIERRAARKQAAADLADNLRDWRQKKAQKALKSAVKRAKKLRKQPRGVDRVPAHLQGLSVTVEPVLVGKRSATPLAQPEDLHPAGNHAARRARGKRDKQRPLRTRELPGAVARRVERNRKMWEQAS